MHTQERMASSNRWGTLLVVTLVSISMVGCTTLNKSEEGAVVGAGTGAVVGAAVGTLIGSTAKGAIVGAVVGGAAGAVIGSQMDKQAEELEEDLEDAEVARVGEGIVVTFDSGLLFDFDSDMPREEAKANLADLAASVKEYENTDVLIIGHTDDIGSA